MREPIWLNVEAKRLNGKPVGVIVEVSTPQR